VGTRLSGADLREADLVGADLRGSGVNPAHLGGTRLRGARYDETTTWPRFFDPDKRGCVRFDSTPARDPATGGQSAGSGSPGSASA
jgi:hypothetical protein